MFVMPPKAYSADTLFCSCSTMIRPITTRTIDSFECLAKYTEDRDQKYQQLETVHLSKGQKLNRLKELSKMHALFAEVISYNRKNLERELQNESRQHNRQQSRPKRRGKKFNVNFIVKTSVFLYN